MKYGPYSERIEKILTQFVELSPEQVKKMQDAWKSILVSDWDAALSAILITDSDAGWNAIQYEIWTAFQYTVKDLNDTTWEAARGAAWEAARGAILALFAQDKISQEHFDVLYGPWKDVMES